MTTKWLSPTNAPRDGTGLVALVMITCECGKGGVCVVAAGRTSGEWVLAGMEHSCEILGYAQFTVPRNAEIARLARRVGLDLDGNYVAVGNA